MLCQKRHNIMKRHIETDTNKNPKRANNEIDYMLVARVILENTEDMFMYFSLITSCRYLNRIYTKETQENNKKRFLETVGKYQNTNNNSINSGAYIKCYTKYSVKKDTTIKYGQFTSYIKYNDIKDRVVENVFNKNDKPHGLYQSFYLSGKPKLECSYDNGELHGKYIYYYENGVIKIEGQYEYGKKTGKWIRRQLDGTERKINHFVNGLKNGEATKWNNRVLLIKAFFNNGIIDGPYNEYYNTGELKEKAYVKDGKYDGDYIKYF